MPVFEYRIHPSVGIARMGDSENAYFVGREHPVDRFEPTLATIPGKDAAKLPGTKPFRDKDDKLAKQAGRFRIFCFEYDDFRFFRDAHPTRVWEVTTDDYTIAWKVKVANKKSREGATLRPNEPDEKSFSTTVAGDFTAIKTFTGKPAGRLNLGHAFLDTKGQLMVLGSSGASRGIPGLAVANAPGLRWKNWEDDAADGYVKATVTPKAASSKPDKGKPAAQARQATVVIGVPAYGMDVVQPVSLYQTALNHALVNAGMVAYFPRPYYSAPLTYHANIEPVLKAYVSNKFTSPEARKHVESGYAAYLATPPDADAKNIHLFLRAPWDVKSHTAENIWTVTPPSTHPYEATSFGMPKLKYLALPEIQYKWMAAWKDTKTTKGDPKVFAPGGVSAKRARLLDHAHLGSMCGGSFYPGIEAGRDVHNYKKWTADWGASARHVDIRWGGAVGEMTQNLAVPWQSDFVACNVEYWPASRPIEVTENGAAFYIWMHDGVGRITQGDFVTKWAQLGFVRYESGTDDFRESSRLIGHP